MRVRVSLGAPKFCSVNSAVEGLLYTEKVGSSILSLSTIYDFSKMNITPRYERGSGSLILSGRANLEVWLSWFKAAVLKTVVR